MYILVDCNQFYVSCERVFRPELEGKPIAVLSNNDGCIIARSPEVKALGIPMGDPYFKHKETFERHRIIFFSSNYALYGDISERVMSTLASFGEEMEIYSIDEAFLYREGEGLEEFCREVKAKVKKWVGIPVSVGAGPTKTLAKVANDLCKKMKSGVFIIKALDPCLKKLPVEDVWGIGRRKAITLKKKGIYTAYQFATADEGWIQKILSVVSLRTALELRGISCLDMEEAESPKKGIMCSRSFGETVYDLDSLLESVALYASRAAEKLRDQGSAAGFIQVFLLSNRFDPNFAHYSRTGSLNLPEHTCYTPTLIEHAKKILRGLYCESIPYKKTGVFLGNLTSLDSAPMDLFSGTQEQREKRERLMMLLDEANEKKSGRLFFLAEGIEKGWKMKRSLTSPSYTTSWDDLLEVKAD